MPKCTVWGCQNEAMGGKEGMPCLKHFLEDVHSALDRSKRKREQRIQRKEGDKSRDRNRH